MAKFNVYYTVTVQYCFDGIEADTEESAIAKAEKQLEDTGDDGTEVDSTGPDHFRATERPK